MSKYKKGEIMYWSRILFDGALCSLIFGVIVVGTMLYNPRLWLQDMPPDIQALVPPKTLREKRATLLFGIPLVGLMLGYPVASALLVESQMGIQLSYVQAFLHVYAVFMFFNIFDWLVIDWGTMLFWKPEWALFPGTRGAAGYKDYAFHFRGFLKGTAMGLVFSLPLAGLVLLM